MGLTHLPLELLFKIFDYLKISDLSSIYELFPDIVMSYAKYRKINIKLMQSIAHEIPMEQVIFQALESLDVDANKITYCLAEYLDLTPYYFLTIPKSMFGHKFPKEENTNDWSFTSNELLIRIENASYFRNRHGIFLLPKYEEFVRKLYGDSKGWKY